MELQQAQIQMLKARLAAAENKTGCWAQKMICDESLGIWKSNTPWDAALGTCAFQTG